MHGFLSLTSPRQNDKCSFLFVCDVMLHIMCVVCAVEIRWTRHLTTPLMPLRAKYVRALRV